MGRPRGAAPVGLCFRADFSHSSSGHPPGAIGVARWTRPVGRVHGSAGVFRSCLDDNSARRGAGPSSRLFNQCFRYPINDLRALVIQAMTQFELGPEVLAYFGERLTPRCLVTCHPA